MTSRDEVVLMQLAHLSKKQDEMHQELKTEIKSLDSKVDTLLQKELPALQVELAMLKVRSGLWGAAAGVVPLALTWLYQHFPR